MFRSILLSSSAVTSSFPIPAWSQPHAPAVESIVVTASPLAGANLATIPAKVDAEQILKQGGSSLPMPWPIFPASPAPASPQAPAARSSAAWTPTGCASWKTAPGSSDVSDIGPDHGVPIDPISARSIEVVRGARTCAMAARRSAASSMPSTTASPDPARQAVRRSTGAYDFVSDAGQGAALGDLKLGKFAFHADGLYRHTDNYDTPLGTQANSFFRGDGCSLGGSYFFGGRQPRRARRSCITDAKYGIPSDVTYINMRQTKLLTGSRWIWAAGCCTG